MLLLYKNNEVLPNREIYLLINTNEKNFYLEKYYPFYNNFSQWEKIGMMNYLFEVTSMKSHMTI